MNITEDRKSYHNLEADLFKPEPDEEELCPHCGGPMEPMSISDSEHDSFETEMVCKNPDCPSKDY